VIAVNGAPSDAEAGVRVSELVAAVVESVKGVAVAVNGEVVPRSAWEDTVLADGDRVEILTAAQGG
jgi:sulfur carrier protein